MREMKRALRRMRDEVSEVDSKLALVRARSGRIRAVAALFGTAATLTSAYEEAERQLQLHRQGTVASRLGMLLKVRAHCPLAN